MSFKFIPQTQNIIKRSYQKSLPEVDIVEVDTEYTNAVLISNLSNLSFKRNLPTQRQTNSSVYKVIRTDSQDKIYAECLQGETQ